MTRRGFTIVELIIVITIVGILLTLAVVGLNGTQAKARDDERKTDIATIGTYLESHFTAGSPINGPGQYPPTELASEQWLKPYLPDADLKAFTAPGSSSPYDSFIPATNNTPTTSGVLPQPTTAQYVYQPLRADGSLCADDTEECRKFNLYYRLEEDATVHKATSRNQ